MVLSLLDKMSDLYIIELVLFTTDILKGYKSCKIFFSAPNTYKNRNSFFICRMSTSFRKATFGDISVINQLAQIICREHYPAIISMEQIEFMLLNRYSSKAIESDMSRGEQYFLAYVNNNPVGYSSIERNDSFYYLHKFYLEVSKHGNGIGKQFFDYLLSQIDGTKPIKLQVNRANYKAINFYFKNGFVIETVGDFDIGGGYFMNDFVMLRQPTH